MLSTKVQLPINLKTGRANCSQRTPLGPRDTFVIEERSGGIVLPATNNSKCRQIAFNNDTGRMVESSKPCEKKPALDDKGVPVPEATMRRMDSIRQGFAK